MLNFSLNTKSLFSILLTILIYPQAGWSASTRTSCKLSSALLVAAVDESVVIKATFSERLLRFRERDVKIKNGVINDFYAVKGSSTSYSFRIDAKMPRGETEIGTTLEIPAGSLKAKSGRVNSACSLKIKFSSDNETEEPVIIPDPDSGETLPPDSVVPTLTPEPSPLPEVEPSALPTVVPTIIIPTLAPVIPTQIPTLVITAPSISTARPSSTATSIATSTSTPVPTKTFTATPTQTTVATSTKVATATSTAISTATATPIATSTPTHTATVTKTSTPASIATALPSPTPTRIPTPLATSSGQTNVIAQSCQGTPVSDESNLSIFPGAEGFGTNTVAGSGRNYSSPCGSIYRINNLGDKGPGSLRECIEARGPRTCIFEVGGVIWATKALKISNPYITIAGQTAPSPGIIIRGSGMSVEASNVLVRSIKVRPGDDPRGECCKTGTCSTAAAQFCTQDPGSRDGINTYASVNAISNIVFDHVSISWALDEGFSVSPASGDISNVTLSNSIVTNGLDMSIHPEASNPADPGHSKAMLINGAYSVKNLSFHKNLLAHNAERNIRVSTPLSMEYINNVIYNWGRGKGAGRLIEATNTRVATHLFDLIGNVYLPGPDSYCPETQYRPELCASVPNGVDSPEQRQKMHYILRVGSGISAGLSMASRYFLNDNWGPTRQQIGNDWDIVDRGFFLNSSSNSLIYPQNQATIRVASSGSVNVLSSQAAFDHVVANSGAFPRQRDIVDNSAINSLVTGTGRIINCVEDDGSSRCAKNAGGWPIYSPAIRNLHLPASPFADSNGNGYTDFEDWLEQF